MDGLLLQCRDKPSLSHGWVRREEDGDLQPMGTPTAMKLLTHKSLCAALKRCLREIHRQPRREERGLGRMLSCAESAGLYVTEGRRPHRQGFQIFVEARRWNESAKPLKT